MHTLRAILDLLALGCTAAAAIAAWRSANAAERAATEARKGIQAQLLVSLLDQHASLEALESFNRLRAWQKSRGDDFAREFAGLRTQDYKQVVGVDRARRRISMYLYKVYHLAKVNLISDEVLTVVMPKTTAEFCREVLEPLEAAVRPNYESASFEWLAERFRVTPRP